MINLENIMSILVPKDDSNSHLFAIKNKKSHELTLEVVNLIDKELFTCKDAADYLNITKNACYSRYRRYHTNYPT